MDLESIETRMNEITSLLDSPESNLEDLEKEIRSLKEQKRQILEDIEKRKAEEKEVIESAKVIDEFKEERKNKMELRDLLKSDAYIDAYAKYIKTGSDREIRSLATENIGTETEFDTVPIPTYLAERINTAWERNEFVRRIPKTYFKGNYREVFELSATGAVVHTEGDDAPDEEQLTFGVVEIVNQNLKKWIKVTTELMSLKGRAFLDYLYDEIEYQISKAVETQAIEAVMGAVGASTPFSIGVPTVTVTNGNYAKAIIEATGKVIAEAKPILVMARQTWANIKAQALDGNFAYDPFNGYEVLFNNGLLLPNTEVILLIDPEALVINLPDGNEPRILVDELSLAEYDIVKIVGKQMVGVGLVKPERAVVIGNDVESSDDESGESDEGDNT